jgi:hypothetical protein
MRGMARLKPHVRTVLQRALDAAQLPEAPRDTFLALSEYARRTGGEIPGGGRLVDLTAFELRVFSQNGEDGVLAEILRRTGAPTRYFVEFGAGYGFENNCAVLADCAGWSGLFVDAGSMESATLARKYGSNSRVSTLRAMVTPENVEALFEENAVPAEPDVLSIDVDGADYWIWEALSAYRPRVIVIEYNGTLEPGRRLVQPRDRGSWDQTEYYGASLDALVSLGERKGYRLVHSELTGNNAFFVREDLPGEYPPADEVPHRAANLFLANLKHKPDFDGRAYVELG